MLAFLLLDKHPLCLFCNKNIEGGRLDNMSTISEKAQKKIDIPETMKAAFLKATCTVSVQEVEVPEVGPNDVLVQVMAVGICGSDLHYYEHGRIGKRRVKYPHIQGHEFAGVVVDVGVNVSRFKVGDRVSVEPGVTCMACEWCREGRYNLCPDVQFLSTPPIKGAFVQYIKHREDFVFHIPDHVSYEEASLIEPLSVGIHAMKRVGIQPGDSVVITGMGPVGLLAVVAARFYGATEVIVTDIEPSRLQLAKKLGATKMINVTQSNVLEEVMKVTSDKGVDAVIETSGNVRVLQSSLDLIKRGGTLSVIGFPAEDEVPLNVTLMLQKEINLVSIYRYANAYPLGIEILSSGQYPLKEVITDRYSLDDIQQAMEQARTNKGQSIKVMIFPN
jgi:L-iditol 2-dehydrogenase